MYKFDKVVTKKEWIFWIILFSTIFLYPVFSNFYPYVFSDTGTYISSGFTNEVPIDRPIFYGLFVRHISLSESLWLVTFGQSLIMIILLAFVQQIILEKRINSRILLLSFIFTGFVLLYFSALPFLIASILPDVFTAVPLLLALIIIFSPKSNKITTIILSVSYIFFSMTHMSNTASLSLLFIILVLLQFVFRIAIINHKKLWFITLLTLSIYVIMPAINSLFGYGFKSTKSFHIFTLATFIDNGLLKDYLSTQEEAKQYKLYSYRDSLPKSSGEFIWSDQSPLTKTGGFGEDNKKEYNEIIGNIIFSKTYFLRWLKWDLYNTLKQLTMNNFGSDFLPYNENSAPRSMVKTHFENELIFYDKSGQNTNQLSFNFGKKSNTQNILIIGSLFIISCGFLLKKLSSPIMVMILITMLYIICNSAVTAVFSCTGDRYNSRITWLLLFFGTNLIILFLIKVIPIVLNKINQQTTK